MASQPPSYQTLPSTAPLWVTEPFRVFFPLGILAALAGLLLWPLHHAGWWTLYPALQHPRLLVFGFGAAFVFGFLGTAWPRFLGAEALRPWELAALAATWLLAQGLYLKGAIPAGDLAAAWSAALLLLILARRFRLRAPRVLPPPGFALAFVSVALATACLLLWATGIGGASPRFQALLRLAAYQGFLLLPLLGVGSYLFGRFFQVPGKSPRPAPRRGLAVWTAAGIILASFAVEAGGWTRTGNFLRLAAMAIWAAGAVPSIWLARAPGTRAWTLRLGLLMIAATWIWRMAWPQHHFAAEHLLFLGGFSLVMLLTADRVILGHSDQLSSTAPRSKAWRWFAWLILLAAATRASADLFPSTRVSHHVYASIILGGVLVAWLLLHRRGLLRPGGE